MPEVLTLRRAMLHISTSLMEAAWIGPLAVALVPPLVAVPLSAVVLVLWAVVALYALLARRLLLTSRSSQTVYTLLVLVPLVSYMVAARLILYPHAPWLSWRWLSAVLFRPLYILSPGRELGLLITVALLWWRALRVTQLPERVAVLAFRFRAEVLALVVGLTLLATMNHRAGVFVVWAFFFASLVAMALVRAEEVGDLEGARGEQFERLWVALVLGSALVIVGLSALLAGVITFENVARVYGWVRPVLSLIGLVLFYVLVLLGWAIGTVVLWLARFFIAHVNIRIDPSTLEIPEALQEPPPAPLRVDHPWLAWLAQRAEQVAGAAVIVLLFTLIALGVRREVRRRRLIREEGMAVGEMGEVAADMRRGVRQLWARFRETMHLLRLYGPRREFLAALSVYNIYINLLRFSERWGLPRKEAETPYEHLERLEAAFPAVATEARLITDAFVAACYGDVSVDPEALVQLRAAWERLRAYKAHDTSGTVPLHPG